VRLLLELHLQSVAAAKGGHAQFRAADRKSLAEFYRQDQLKAMRLARMT
jgi:hypothetical protein